MGGSQNSKVFGQLAGVCLDRRTSSLPCDPVPRSHSKPWSSPQPGEEKVGTMSGHTIPGHGSRLHCFSDLGKEGGNQGLPGTFLPGSEGHLETMPMALGADGGNSPNSSTGLPLYVSSTQVSSQQGTTPMVSATRQCTGHPQTATGPPLVEVPEQSRQGEQSGPGDPLPISVIRRIPRRHMS